jgi:hypothetical protein
LAINALIAMVATTWATEGSIDDLAERHRLAEDRS